MLGRDETISSTVEDGFVLGFPRSWLAIGEVRDSIVTLEHQAQRRGLHRLRPADRGYDGRPNKPYGKTSATTDHDSFSARGRDALQESIQDYPRGRQKRE